MVDDGEDVRTHVDEVQPSYGDSERLPDGSEIEGYVIDAVIGKGGMGVVYSATHKLIGKRCAIKVLRSEVSSNEDTVQRFIQEARAVNQIGHANIVDIFDFGRLPDGRCYHLMDLLVGESLRRRLRRGPLHPSEAASVLEGVTAALIAVHDKGFIHRDLKPDNIFLSTATESEWPEVKLLDFGLAKLMPEAGVAAFTTKTGVMLGTPEYMSPEQARGQRVDYRTDIYALGVMMFEILTGQRPFPSGPDAFTTLQYHADEPAPSLAVLVPELPGEMVQLVEAMLAKEPGARPSLAAVRTVIKRLRTTKLPSRAPSVDGGLSSATLQAMGLGAEPMLAPPPLHRDVSQPIAAAGIPLDSFRPASSPLSGPPSTLPASTPSEPVSGLAQPGAPAHAGTTLGVPPPPKHPSSRPFLQAAPAPVVARNSRRTWLIAGGVLSIVAGIAVALVATGVIP